VSSKAQAIIYLANQRGCSETTWFRSYYTFNFGEFKRESRTPFGSLVAVNEHTLKEGRTLSFAHPESSNVLILPIAGELNYRYGLVMHQADNFEKSIDVGQASYVELPAGTPWNFQIPLLQIPFAFCM
jgi:hypothetical protein